MIKVKLDHTNYFLKHCSVITLSQRKVIIQLNKSKPGRCLRTYSCVIYSTCGYKSTQIDCLPPTICSTGGGGGGGGPFTLLYEFSSIRGPKGSVLLAPLVTKRVSILFILLSNTV